MVLPSEASKLPHFPNPYSLSSLTTDTRKFLYLRFRQHSYDSQSLPTHCSTGPIVPGAKDFRNGILNEGHPIIHPGVQAKLDYHTVRLVQCQRPLQNYAHRKCR